MNRRSFFATMAGIGAAVMLPVKAARAAVPAWLFGCRVCVGNQVRTVVDYDPTTNVVTIDRSWSTQPGPMDTVVFLDDTPGRDVQQV